MSVSPRLLAPALLLVLLSACDAGEPVGPTTEVAPDVAFGTGGTPEKTTNQIVIRLDVQPNDAQDVRFAMTGAKRANILLDDDDDPSLANLRVVPSLKPGTYRVDLQPLSGGSWLVAINCISSGNGGAGVNNTTVNVQAGSVIIPLESLEQVVCTFVVAMDLSAPTVTIEAESPYDAAIGCNTSNLLVEFSEPVTGFDASDLAFSGSAAGSVVGITGSGASYVVEIAPTAFGELTVTIPAGAAIDAGGNASEASTSATGSTLYVGAFCGDSGV